MTLELTGIGELLSSLSPGRTQGHLAKIGTYRTALDLPICNHEQDDRSA
jgi:hypothetical protein